MSRTIITVNFSDEEEKRLDELVDFFQKKTITQVTRSDVIKFLINRVHLITEGNNLEQTIEFYKTLGIDFDFEVLHEIMIKK